MDAVCTPPSEDEGASTPGVRFEREKRDTQRVSRANEVIGFRFSFKLNLDRTNQTNDKLSTQKHETMVQVRLVCGWSATLREPRVRFQKSGQEANPVKAHKIRGQ